MTESTRLDRFLRRQFAAQVTGKQIAFDIGMGILLPILCLLLDPIIFRNRILGLEPLKVFAYCGAGLAVLILGLWLLLQTRLKHGSGLMAGVLFSGALVPFAIGALLVVLLLAIVVLALVNGSGQFLDMMQWTRKANAFAARDIMPIVMSTISTCFVIAIGAVLVGVLEFFLLSNSFAFFRNGVRAFREAQVRLRKAWLAGSLLLGVLLTVALPAAAQWQTSRFVSQRVDAILQGTAQEAEQAARGLQQAFWCGDECYDRIIWVYRNEKDPARRERLAEMYREITGEDIEMAARRMLTY